MAISRSQPAAATITAGLTTSVIPAETGAAGVVTGAIISATTAGTLKFQSHTTTTKNTGPISIPVGTTVIPWSPDGWFSGASGEGVDIVTATMVGNIALTFAYNG